MYFYNKIIVQRIFKIKAGIFTVKSLSNVFLE